VKKPIGGGSARVEALAPPRTARKGGGGAWLENERLLAAMLLTPTVVLLGLFIAYPFVMGVWLALSNTSVGNVGEFVGLKNFYKAWNDSIFRTAFWNTTWYTAWATVFKLTLGMWLAGVPWCGLFALMVRSTAPMPSRRSGHARCLRTYSKRMLVGASRMRNTRAGTPATTALAGTSRVTTALVPITALSPTVTPRRMQAP